MSLAERILSGEIRAAARLMRLIDDRNPTAAEEMQNLYRHTGKAHVIGVTGPPGAGKSTLTDKLIAAYRAKDLRVGVVAIDPTSPFSGGAILGDRIRMNRHATDEGVFIRSLGTRGHLGGLSSSTADVVHVLDAMGFDIIIIETVGVGQDEVEIVDNAHTSLVVMVPGLGDDIQAIKAGILEIGDIFVVNKSDRPDADRTVRELTTMVEMNHPDEGEWFPPVVQTVAQKDDGVTALVEQIEEHRGFLNNSGAREIFETNRCRIRFLEMLREGLFEEVCNRYLSDATLEENVKKMASRSQNPYSLVEAVLEKSIKR